VSQDINENIDENKTLNEENEKTCEQNDQDNDNGLESELAKVKEDLIRATADFENIKKRLEREKADALKFANEGFARDLLPVIDALEIAANINGSDDIAAMKDGINLTIEQFKKCFEKYGI
jgi:molecular chaperone GrpE